MRFFLALSLFALLTRLLLCAVAAETEHEETRYRTAVRGYLRECLTAAKMLGRRPPPTPGDYRRQIDRAFAAYARIGAAPQGMDPHHVLATHLNDLRVHFGAGQVFVARGDHASCLALAETQRWRIGAVEEGLAKRD